MESDNNDVMRKLFGVLKEKINEGFKSLEEKFEQRLQVLEKRLGGLNSGPLGQSQFESSEMKLLRQGEEIPTVNNEHFVEDHKEEFNQFSAFYRSPNGYLDIVRHLEHNFKWFPAYIFKEDSK